MTTTAETTARPAAKESGMSPEARRRMRGRDRPEWRPGSSG